MKSFLIYLDEEGVGNFIEKIDAMFSRLNFCITITQISLDN